MTAPTREQVVTMARTAFGMQYCALPVPEYQIETLASMIRADLEATITEQAAEIATLQSKADALAELLIKSTIDEWQPGFTNREYDSNKPKENEFRELVLSALAAYKESKQ